MRPKVVAKLALDTAMAALLFVLMAHNLTESALHEVLGILMFVLFILHHLLNLNWYRIAFTEKQSLARTLDSAVNVLLFLVMAGVATSSVMVSKQVFLFTNVRGGLFAHKLHTSMTTWCFVLVAVHLGFRWSMVAGVAKRLTNTVHKRTGKTVLRFAAVMISAYGIVASFTHEIGAKLIMYYGYSFWDLDRNKLFFFTDLLAVMGLYVCATHYSIKLIRKTTQKIALEAVGS